jgi:hypothetical protein
MEPVLVLGHFVTLARSVSDWSQHQYLLHGINTPKPLKNLWLYTTVVLLTMDEAQPMAVHYSCAADNG